MKAKRFSDYPFNSVSFHGPFDLSVYTDPNPAFTEVIRICNQGKAFAMQPFTLFVYLIKLPSFAQQMILPESEHLVTVRQTAASGPWRDAHLK